MPSIFKLPHEDGPILVRGVPRPSTHNRPLDLDLTATDDAQMFSLRLQHSKISRYRNEGGPLSHEEWESCLTSLLLGTQPISHFHVDARFDNGNLEIDIGNRVSGAKNTAGTLILTPSESSRRAFDWFQWTCEAASRQNQLAEELAELKRKHADLERLVTEETVHIKALERSKHEFESEHDSFFRDLLNEKKLKIRTQEQILSTAHVDEAKLAALNSKAKAGKSETTSRHPDAVGSSRKGKRKAESLGDDTDDDADKMDIDEESMSPDQELSDAEQTTEEEQTASEPEPEPEPEPDQRSKKHTGSSGAKKAGRGSLVSASKSVAKSNKPPRSNLRGKSPAVAADDEDKDMPAPRALPFGRKAKPVPDPADDESTASES